MKDFEPISSESLAAVSGGRSPMSLKAELPGVPSAPDRLGFKPFKNIGPTSGVPLKAEMPGVRSAPDLQGYKPFNNIGATSPHPVEAVMM
jgi:hypothetical protein